MNIYINWRWAGAGVGISLILAVGVWFIFFRGSETQGPTSGTFGSGNNISTTVTTSASGTNQPINTEQVGQQIIFKIAEGPVTGATLIQTLRPTTTIARYVLQDNGHVFDLPVDSPGAVPKAVSNTTIPGTARAMWVEKGSGVILQYLDAETIKTVYLGLPASSTQATRIQFLPNNISDLATSPDGKNIAYLTPTASGNDGYTAKSDGGASKKLFSVPLSQLSLSWPSSNILLLQTKPAAGVPGSVFSVSTQTGSVLPFLYAEGLTAIADKTFSTVVYQTAQAGSALRSTYSHNVKNNTDTPLSFDPFPEKCIQSSVATTTLYCAAPLQYVAPNYIDLWRGGAVGVADSIFAFNIFAGRSEILAVPGSADGGVQSDIVELALSPDEKYLLFVKKGDRSLWSVRLK